jgi:O-antigen ligase
MIRNKIKLFDGKLKYPLVMLLLAMLLSTINAETFTISYIFYYFIGIFYLFIYFFFKGSLKGDNLEYLIKLFSILGVMIAVQILLYHLRLDDILYEIRNNDIDLGWGISNFAATYLVMFITAIFYYVKVNKKGFLLIPLILFEITMLLLTSSRGGFLAFGTALIFLLIFLIHDVKNKWKIGIYLLILLALSLIVVFLNLDFFLTMFRRLFSNFFDDNHRFTNWGKGWVSFTSNPIFGSGIFAEVNDYYFKLYHSTIIHTLATLGIFGMLALIWQFWEIFKIFITNLTQKKTILLIAIVAANVQGLIDNVYYMPQFMIIFFIIISATENYDKKNLINF